MGEMADMTFFDDPFEEYDGETWNEPGPRTWKTCRYCGTEMLHWASTPDGWRLADDNGLHVCPAKTS